MRTAQRAQVVKFKTFLRTLLHELCHHLDYQQLGLGRVLLQALTEAAQQNGIERFRAEVSAENQQVIQSLIRAGATPGSIEDSAISLELHLPIKAFGSSAMYEALRAVAADRASRASS